jgi:hypothetical protein
LKTYTLRRAGGGLLATRVALAHNGRVVRLLLAVDTGSLYTIVEPTFLTALGIEPAQAVNHVEIVGIGGQLRVPRVTVERCHCFGQMLSAVQVLTLDFSRILPSINGILGLRELRASQAMIDVVRNVVTIP